MAPLERLFRLEVEFHRRLRIEAPGQLTERAAAHTNYALQNGYEDLLRAARGATAREIEVLKEKLTLAGDARDVLAARDSLKQLLEINPLAS